MNFKDYKDEILNENSEGINLTPFDNIFKIDNELKKKEYRRYKIFDKIYDLYQLQQKYPDINVKIAMYNFINHINAKKYNNNFEEYLKIRQQKKKLKLGL